MGTLSDATGDSSLTFEIQRKKGQFTSKEISRGDHYI